MHNTYDRVIGYFTHEKVFFDSKPAIVYNANDVKYYNSISKLEERFEDLKQAEVMYEFVNFDDNESMRFYTFDWKDRSEFCVVDFDTRLIQSEEMRKFCKPIWDQLMKISFLRLKTSSLGSEPRLLHCVYIYEYEAFARLICGYAYSWLIDTHKSIELKKEICELAFLIDPSDPLINAISCVLDNGNPAFRKSNAWDEYKLSLYDTLLIGYQQTCEGSKEKEPPPKNSLEDKIDALIRDLDKIKRKLNGEIVLELPKIT